MRYAVEMGIPKLIGGIHIHRDSQTAWRSHKPTFLILKYESRLARSPSILNG
jgi:hypothetical protein